MTIKRSYASTSIPISSIVGPYLLSTEVAYAQLLLLAFSKRRSRRFAQPTVA